MKKVIRLKENDIEKLVKKILKENDEQLNMEFPEDENEEEEGEDYGQGYEMGEEFAGGLLEEIEGIRGEEELLDTALRGFVDGFNDQMESNGIDLELSHLMKGWREGSMQESYRLRDIISENKVNEAWPQKELDRKATNFRRSSFNPYKREKDIKSLFGSYGEEIPPQVLQYLRKNPRLLIKRLVDIYGIDEIYNYIELATETNPVQESYSLDDIISEKEEKFIQKAEKKMEKKGTVGSFREYCGGEVTMACINKGLKSDDPSIVKKANYAKNIGGYKGAKRK